MLKSNRGPLLQQGTVDFVALLGVATVDYSEGLFGPADWVCAEVLPLISRGWQ
jgi:hypothetical protein